MKIIIKPQGQCELMVRHLLLYIAISFITILYPSFSDAGQLAWPVSCIPGVTCDRDSFSIGFPDLDGDLKAFDCRRAGYKGHTGTDVFVPDVDRGVSVVAAESGEVVWVQDGRFDRCPDPNEPQCRAGIKKICSMPSDSTGRVFSVNCTNGACDCLWGFNPGNFVLLRHDTTTGVAMTFYAHLKKESISVKVGQTVSRGEKLAEVGSSGNALRPHLHFGVWAVNAGLVDLVDPWSGQCGTNDSASLWEFDPPYRADLLVERKGRGYGEVRADVDSFSCGKECSGSFIPGTTVTLKAVSSAGSTFAGWGGDCTSTTETCTFVISGKSRVRAVFQDIEAPRIVSFHVPPISDGPTVPITYLNAEDNVSVSSYLITESAERPSLGDEGWQGSVPRSFTLSSPVSKAIYAWARDMSGNISQPSKATVNYSGAAAKVSFKPDTLHPVVVDGKM